MQKHRFSGKATKRQILEPPFIFHRLSPNSFLVLSFYLQLIILQQLKLMTKTFLLCPYLVPPWKNCADFLSSFEILRRVTAFSLTTILVLSFVRKRFLDISYAVKVFLVHTKIRLPWQLLMTRVNILGWAVWLEEFPKDFGKSCCLQQSGSVELVSSCFSKGM